MMRRPVPGDHPRIRGEHSDRGYPGCGGCGSSPHTRGARAAHLRADRCVSDHPRIRGEHHREGSGINMDLGSSPHTRGAPVGAGRALAPGGIIPAYAGSTGGVSLRVAFLSDHPRIRGEHRNASSRASQAAGSSPHTRGAHLRLRLATRQLRIIPAYAGSTSRGRRLRHRWRDHPRIRGEHAARGAWPVGADGSSPHTRGALPRDQAGLFEARIIPAYAGSTTSSVSRELRTADHPRIRGEHGSWTPSTGPSPGSSPHTRGARSAPSTSTGCLRIIPAYAGSTATRTPAS